MATMTISDPTALIGFVAFDAEGEKLGEIEGVYQGVEAPEWAAVLMDGQFVIIPLHEAALYEDSLDIPYTLADVQDAPLQQPELLEDLSEDHEEQLLAYYGAEQADAPLPEAGNGSGAGVREAGTEVAATAREQTQEVASAAKKHTAQVASTAKEQGQRVASTAKQQGHEVVVAAKEHSAEVVGTAKQQASEVAQQASAQARNLLDETRARLEDQTAEGAHKLGDNLSRFGSEAIALADGRPDDAPTLQRYVQRSGESLLDAAERAYGLSDEVRSRGIGSVLADVQTFARRRPGVFLLGTAVVGVMAGRAVRNAQDDDGAAGQGGQPVAALPRSTNARTRVGTRGAR